jgi:hypothetical protein
MRIQLVIPRGHAAKLLEAAKEPLNRVTLCIPGYVVGPRVSTLTPGRNQGTSAGGGQGPHQRVGIVAAVSHDIRRVQPGEQRQGLRRIVPLALRQATTHKPTARIGHRVQLGRQPTTAAPEGLRPVFLRAPLACWWTRTVVESTSSMCSASSCCTAASTRAHTPEVVQRWKRVYVVCQLPHAVGSARHRQPLRVSHTTASTKRRLPGLVPLWSLLAPEAAARYAPTARPSA